MPNHSSMPLWMRIALIAAGVVNLFGALLFLPASSALRTANSLPDGSHPFYLAIISSWIFLFGLCYLWLGIKGKREVLFLVIGAAGKTAFVVLAFLFAAPGDIPISTAISSLPDLAFAANFAYYLVSTTDD